MFNQKVKKEATTKYNNKKKKSKSKGPNSLKTVPFLAPNPPVENHWPMLQGYIQ